MWGLRKKKNRTEKIHFGAQGKGFPPHVLAFLKKEKWIFAWPWQLKAKSGVGWVGAFLSKGAILPWAGGQGRKAQQSYLEGESLELCWAFSEE